MELFHQTSSSSSSTPGCPECLDGLENAEVDVTHLAGIADLGPPCINRLRRQGLLKKEVGLIEAEPGIGNFSQEHVIRENHILDEGPPGFDGRKSKNIESIHTRQVPQRAPSAFDLAQIRSRIERSGGIIHHFLLVLEVGLQQLVARTIILNARDRADLSTLKGDLNSIFSRL